MQKLKKVILKMNKPHSFIDIPFFFLFFKVFFGAFSCLYDSDRVEGGRERERESDMWQRTSGRI